MGCAGGTFPCGTPWGTTSLSMRSTKINLEVTCYHYGSELPHIYKAFFRLVLCHPNWRACVLMQRGERRYFQCAFSSFIRIFLASSGI